MAVRAATHTRHALSSMSGATVALRHSLSPVVRVSSRALASFEGASRRAEHDYKATHPFKDMLLPALMAAVSYVGLRTSEAMPSDLADITQYRLDERAFVLYKQSIATNKLQLTNLKDRFTESGEAYDKRLDAFNAQYTRFYESLERGQDPGVSVKNALIAENTALNALREERFNASTAILVLERKIKQQEARLATIGKDLEARRVSLGLPTMNPALLEQEVQAMLCRAEVAFEESRKAAALGVILQAFRSLADLGILIVYPPATASALGARIFLIEYLATCLESDAIGKDNAKLVELIQLVLTEGIDPKWLSKIEWQALKTKIEQLLLLKSLPSPTPSLPVIPHIPGESADEKLKADIIRLGRQITAQRNDVETRTFEVHYLRFSLIKQHEALSIALAQLETHLAQVTKNTRLNKEQIAWINKAITQANTYPPVELVSSHGWHYSHNPAETLDGQIARVIAFDASVAKQQEELRKQVNTLKQKVQAVAAAAKTCNATQEKVDTDREALDKLSAERVALFKALRG